MNSLYITLIVVIIDQVTKLLVKGFAIPFLGITHQGMGHGQSIPLIGNFFQLTFVENPGMAFGIDLNPTSKLWISVFSIIASGGLVYYLYTVRKQSLSLRIALALILGGAIGNLIDRTLYGVFFDYAPLFYGRVVDFFDVEFWDITLFGRTYDRFPIFNIADSAVSIGVGILLLFYKKHQAEAEALDAAEVAAPSGAPIAGEKMITASEDTVGNSVDAQEQAPKFESDSLPEDGEHNNRKEV
ncbi:MAG: signal peptidase II [Ignavibacteriales bacterium]|nr:signal peptidase II [Ignavibacteriales bacterium]